MQTRLARLFVPLVLAFLGALSIVVAQDDDIAPTHPAIQYARPSNDAAANLLKHPDDVARLTADGPSGFLRSILQALDVPVSSQIIEILRDTKSDLPKFFAG